MSNIHIVKKLSLPLKIILTYNYSKKPINTILTLLQPLDRYFRTPPLTFQNTVTLELDLVLDLVRLELDKILLAFGLRALNFRALNFRALGLTFPFLRLRLETFSFLRLETLFLRLETFLPSGLALL